LFYHYADPEIRNLVSADEYESLEIERLSRHITEFSLAAIQTTRTNSKRIPRTGAVR
jgi:hypothetical protein